MKVNKVSFDANGYPERLRQLAKPPAQLYSLGADLCNLLEMPCLAVIGSRNVSAYGKSVTARLAGEAAQRGIVVISGLALGVDALAHEAALEAGGLTIAVLPAGLDKIYPASHTRLAQRILEQGGALVSEYPEGTRIAFKGNYIARNRIISGLSDAVLITEAAEKSGSLHTARFALEQGREVLAVPGNITSPTSVGTNNLLKTGAVPVTGIEDILFTMGVERLPDDAHLQRRGESTDEQTLIDLMYSGAMDGHELLESSGLEPAVFNTTLTMLEISGKIRPLGNNQWALK